MLGCMYVCMYRSLYRSLYAWMLNATTFNNQLDIITHTNAHKPIKLNTTSYNKPINELFRLDVDRVG